MLVLSIYGDPSRSKEKTYKTRNLEEKLYQNKQSYGTKKYQKRKQKLTAKHKKKRSKFDAIYSNMEKSLETQMKEQNSQLVTNS